MPHLGGLFKPIQRMEKTAHLVRIRGIDVSHRLLYVDLLVKVAVQKGRHDAHLMQLPPVCRRLLDYKFELPRTIHISIVAVAEWYKF